MEERPRFHYEEPDSPERTKTGEPGRFVRVFEKVFPSIISGNTKEAMPKNIEESYFDKRHEIKDLAHTALPVAGEDEQNKADEPEIEAEQPISHIGEVIDQKKTKYTKAEKEISIPAPADERAVFTQAMRQGFITALTLLILIAVLYLLVK